MRRRITDIVGGILVFLLFACVGLDGRARQGAAVVAAKHKRRRRQMLAPLHLQRAPQVKEAATKELMRVYPHLDALMASTIAWYELEKKPAEKGKEDAGTENQTVVS